MGGSADGFAGRVLESMSSGFVAVDAEGRVVLMNDGARALLAQGGPGPIGRDCREVFAGQPTVSSLLLDALQGGGGLSRAELALDLAHGNGPLTLGLTLFPVFDAAGTIDGAAMLFRDLAPIERSNEQEGLQARLAALGQMAAGLAHELRNPLASMELLVGLLQRRLPDGEPRELVADLHTQVRALTDIVNTSLAFVRPEAPRRSLEAAPALVDAAVERVLPRFGHPPAIERHFPTDLPSIPVDPESLTVVLANLIANACEALEGQPGARIVLELECRTCERGGASVRVESAASPDAAKPGRELVIGIRDNGPGVPPELREKIFYPFFTTRPQGSGIGLATVQKVVASHGGTLELDSRPGEGACFRVHLPLDAAGDDA